MLRAWTISGIQTFLPTWYDELGYGKLMQSALVQNLPELPQIRLCAAVDGRGARIF
jgi:hypothetical protein